MDDSTHVKTCTKCGETKLLDEFHVSSKSRDGRAWYCKTCACALRRAHAKANRTRESAATRAYREARPEKYRDYMKKWRADNQERIRESSRRWNEANAERLAEVKRKWTVENYAAIMERRRENWPHVQEVNRRSAAKTRDKRTARQAERRAKLAGSTVTQVDLDELWTGICALCGSPMDRAIPWPEPLSKSIDHIVPLSLGGDHSAANLQWAHLFCNISKGNRI